MKTFEIKGALRKDLGKSSTKKLRREEKVPCVLYGGKENIHFSVLANDLRHLVYTPEVFFTEVELEGKKYRGIMQDLQFHPVSDSILHIDFVEIHDDKAIITKLPVKLLGVAIGIKDGGKLRWKRRYMKLKGLPKDLPEAIEIDIENLAIGDTIKIGDLSFDNLTVLDPLQSMVVAIVSSRVAKGMEEAIEIEGEEEVVEGEETEGAEGAEAGKEAPAAEEKPAEG